MTSDDHIRRAAADGVRMVPPEAWTPQLALDVIRENRRRHAATGRPQEPLLDHYASVMARELPRTVDVDEDDMVKVLPAVSSMLGSVVYGVRASGAAVSVIAGYAADDIDQRKRAS
ncbi:hypothetical protein CDO52_00955 [Nocardiopsis gilva YIM 90087]|uniref:Uncharacterized protein n=1 Tax=Nocardiopsis gilva YIM 90087 TaxID=1235441 RepID=A0A223S0B6_9ACTN|nr:hypothetical protein [Nocardiopsis gilva]ASU81548.1 hypothetical protein CDO52_00955 [Nocardiopsis gilva YIM 90087]